MNNRVGLHLRVQSSILSLLEKAEQVHVPFFQCFFIRQETGKIVGVSAQEIKLFLQIRRARYNDLFCHGSYWINLASLGNNGYHSLRRELELAKRLEFTHFLIHPGTANGAQEKYEGIDALARCLNDILKKEQDIVFLLENTSHGKLAVGSDILDFKLLLERIDTPERVRFCIDTAHAYSFGYNIADNQGQDDFIALLDSAIGLESIKLIHLNDSAHALGSHMDRHTLLGQGRIGIQALSRFASHASLKKIPLLLELPDVPFDQERLMLDLVNSWHKE